jgi:succinoglycan biosynthesis transport protein ExoP
MLDNIALDKIALQPSAVVIAANHSSPELTLREVGVMLTRRRYIIYFSLLLCFVLAIVALIFSTRRYKSVGEIELQKDSTSSLGIQTSDSSDAPSDALEVNMIIQTQAKILQSDSLALRVIEDLHLEQTEDYRKKWSPLDWIAPLFGAGGAPDPKEGSLEDSPHRRMRVLKIFHRKLTVKPVAGTRLIDVEYLSPNPELAAAVVNHLLQGLIEKGFQARYDATMQATTWLGSQLADLRNKTLELQAEEVTLQQEAGVFALGQVDKDGRDQVYNPTVEKLQMATQAEAEAQSNRILKGAINEVVKSGNAELISGLAGNSSTGGGGSSMGTSLNLIQNLRLQEATLQGQLQELSAKFGPTYPKISEVKSNLTAVQAAIHAEVGRVAGRAHNDYMIAQQAEQKTRQDFNAYKSEAEALNNKTIEYQMVRQEADQTRTVYDDMSRHLKESGLLAGLRSTNISVVDWAKPSDTPDKPVILFYLCGSLLVGLVAGVVAALLRDVTDTRIQDLREISRELGPMPLSVLPYQKERPALTGGDGWVAKSPLPALDNPRSLFVESLRSLRTSLMLSRSGAPPRSVLVTSPLSGEGKSFLSWNLAILFAKQGRRVLLCDANLRHPWLHRNLEISPVVGLSTVLAGLSPDHGASVVIPVQEVPGLFLIPAGPLPPYPAELLGSHQMADLVKMWEVQYELVIFDAPPVLQFTDAVVLSSLVNSVLLMAKHQKTPLSALEKSYRMLEEVQSTNGRKINIVINGVKEQPDESYNALYEREAAGA